VGDAPYADDYIAKLKASAGPSVRFPGYVFGEGYAELVHRCGIMCVPTEVGGTHPVIVEAMAAGACLLVSDHPPNLEAVGDAAVSFPLDGGAVALSARLSQLLRSREHRGDLPARENIRSHARYTWDWCARRYLKVASMTSSGRSHPHGWSR
jgi:glycosyltransferase involved in cell wall biosynthesis